MQEARGDSLGQQCSGQERPTRIWQPLAGRGWGRGSERAHCFWTMEAWDYYNGPARPRLWALGFPQGTRRRKEPKWRKEMVSGSA